MLNPRKRTVLIQVFDFMYVIDSSALPVVFDWSQIDSKVLLLFTLRISSTSQGASYALDWIADCIPIQISIRTSCFDPCLVRNASRVKVIMQQRNALGFNALNTNKQQCIAPGFSGEYNIKFYWMLPAPTAVNSYQLPIERIWPCIWGVVGQTFILIWP